MSIFKSLRKSPKITYSLISISALALGLAANVAVETAEKVFNINMDIDDIVTTSDIVTAIVTCLTLVIFIHKYNKYSSDKYLSSAAEKSAAETLAPEKPVLEKTSVEKPAVEKSDIQNIINRSPEWVRASKTVSVMASNRSFFYNHRTNTLKRYSIETTKVIFAIGLGLAIGVGVDQIQKKHDLDVDLNFITLSDIAIALMTIIGYGIIKRFMDHFCNSFYVNEEELIPFRNFDVN